MAVIIIITTMIAGATQTQERGLGTICPEIATPERSGIKAVVMVRTEDVVMTTETGIRPHFFARLPLIRGLSQYLRTTQELVGLKPE